MGEPALLWQYPRFLQERSSSMPAILSHHLFGRALLARQASEKFLTRDERDAFLLGNQGPDPLFFAVRTTAVKSSVALARAMHHAHIDEYLELWRKTLDEIQLKDHVYNVLYAYVRGFLCHYVLDKTVHPLVGAYEQALCGAGIKGLDPKDRAFVHSQIEADLDIYLLHKLTGRTLDEYQIPKQILYASDNLLSDVDLLYRASASLYGVKVPRNVFTRSVKDMRATERLLYSPGGTRRSLAGKAERLVRRHSLLQALSHRPEAYVDNWYANESKDQWIHPYTMEERNESFMELFDSALIEAENDMRLFSEGTPLQAITEGLDFSGKKQGESEDA